MLKKIKQGDQKDSDIPTDKVRRGMQEPRHTVTGATAYLFASSLHSLPGPHTPSKTANMVFARLQLFATLGTELQFRAMSPFFA